MSDAPAASRLKRWSLYLGVWLLVGVLLAGLTVLYSAYAGRPVSWRQALVYPMADALAWAGLALVALALARRFPFERGHLVRGLAVHLPAALVLSVIEAAAVFALFSALGLFQGNAMPARRLFGSMVIGKLQTNVITYAIVVAVGHALDSQRRLREREMRASQLEARLAEARLAALRMQLQPHFLFNTLHAISALMHRDVEAADRMLARLSDLLRLSIDSDRAAEVPLQREIEFLEGYVEIQQARFGERLKVTMDIAPETLDAQVPHLFLQPLVENAIRHGLSDRAAGGTVAVRSQRVGERLQVTVRDDGAGLPEGGVREGLGLANTRARLEALYAAAQRFEIASGPGGGTVVTVEVPWRPAASGANAGAPS